MVIPTPLELSIRTTELSDIFDAFVTIVSSTWEPDYVSHPQVLYFDVWPKDSLSAFRKMSFNYVWRYFETL